MFWNYFGMIGWVFVWALLMCCLQIQLVNSEIPASLLYRLNDAYTLDDVMKVVHIHPRPVKSFEVNPLVDRRVPPKMAPIVPRQSSEESAEEESDEPTVPLHGPSSSLAKPKAPPSSLEIFSLAEMPACVPRPTVVELRTVDDELRRGNEVDDAIYWPPCVTVNRCGGCCSTELQECVSNSSRIKEIQVLRVTTDPESSELHGLVTALPIREDESCLCECKVQPEDCHPTKEVYRNCQCECAVQHDCPAGMVWDPLRCNCVCNVPINERSCKRRKHYFNEEICGCECLERLQTSCHPPNTLNPHTCKCQSPRTKREPHSSSNP